MLRNGVRGGVVRWRKCGVLLLRIEPERQAAGESPDPWMLRGPRVPRPAHEATSRLFEWGCPMEVPTITEHKTPPMLKRYTHPRAEDLMDWSGWD